VSSFLTFPLCLLAFRDDVEDRLNTILAHSMDRAGASDSIDDAAVLQYVTDKGVKDYYTFDDGHKRIVRGAIAIGVDLGNLRPTVQNAYEAAQFIEQMRSKHGTDAMVFISSELFWGCRDRREPTYREFSTLCAINSIIGFKKFPIIIRRGMVIARQLGFKSPDVMAAELKARSRPGPGPLTTQQLRDTLDRLESKELMRRCQATRRDTYCSTTLTYEELRDGVQKIQAEKAKIRLRREADRALFSQEPHQSHNGTATQPLKKKEPKSQEKEPLKNEEPVESHNATTEGTNEATTTGTTKINGSKEMILKKCDQINGSTATPPEGNCIHEANAPELPPQIFDMPTLGAVEEFAKSLRTAKCKWDATARATAWFETNHADRRWEREDWRKVFAKWLFQKRPNHDIHN
jgi:hypothetical protein